MSEKVSSHLILGIDTGGTYTDAALCCETADGMKLLETAKARTTKENLTIGIRNAVAKLNHDLLGQVCRVSLSTTLATNACVEDMGGDVQLVLMNKERTLSPSLCTEYGLPAPEHIIFLPGDINTEGIILERPSHEEIFAALRPVCSPGTCVAISGVFSTRNPELELETAAVAQELGAKVVCGRDVAPGQLNYLRRAATALLNGRLQPLIRDFLESVSQALQEFHMEVPIDIVRSDGSLMNHSFALEYPVETLLCGPAASVSGVIHLLNQQEEFSASNTPQDYLIADIGGTTTDLSLVRNGQAVRTKSGVNIGSYRTSVQSVFVETLGLGGDSRLYVESNRKLALDTNRAIPLCVLAVEHPKVKEELSAMSAASPKNWIDTYEFRVLTRQLSEEELAGLSEEEQRLCAFLAERPHTISSCAKHLNRDTYVFKTTHLEQLGFVRKAAFTLTDVLHLEGSFTEYDVEASRLGAQFFTEALNIDESELCRRGRELALFRLYHAIVRMCIHQDRPRLRQRDESGIERMIESAFYGGALIDTSFHLPIALVGIGAAAEAFLPEVSKRLSTTLILPKAAPVANAVGAAASSVRAEATREIKFSTDEKYVVSGGETTLIYDTYEEAVKEALRQAKDAAVQLARARGILGALQINVTQQRNILDTKSKYGALSFDFGGTVTATAEAESSKLLHGV